MIGTQVHYLSSAGIHAREISGIHALAASLPSNWLLYASLSCYPPRSRPIELDGFLVMDDRVLLLELKDLNGQIIPNGDQWILDSKRQFRSPVALLAEKARKVKGLIAQRVPGLSRILVDFRVILTGTATAANLSADEIGYVWSLAQAQSFWQASNRRRMLDSATLPPVRLFTMKDAFDRFVRNPKLFRPSQMTWDGYRIGEEDLFVHPRNLWREHGAEQVRDSRIKALLRTWSLQNMPAGLNSPDTRKLVVEREARVFGHLRERESRLIDTNGILSPTGAPPDEILTNHFDIFSLPHNWSPLRRYLERNRASLTLDQRLDLASTLVGIVAELHTNGVAHRDLAPACIWLGSPTRVGLTGFMSAQLVADESVQNWLDVLRGYSEALPEDESDELIGTARERDVYQLGLIVREVLEADRMSDADSPAGLAGILEKATARTPTSRYSDAQIFSDALGTLTSSPDPVLDETRLDTYETVELPLVRWPLQEEMAQTPRSLLYTSSSDGVDLCVKIWTGVRRGESRATDLAMLGMFEGVARLRASPVAGLPVFEEGGLSKIGPFLVYRRVIGKPLSDTKVDDPASAAIIIERLGRAVDALHALDCTHGDLGPANILIGEGPDPALTILDLFDLAPGGRDRVRNLAFAPEDWERLSEEQIDRFAVASIAAGLISGLDHGSLPNLEYTVASERNRETIETLEPLLESARRDLRHLREPASVSLILRARGIQATRFVTDEGRLYVNVTRLRDERAEYRVSGLDQTLLLRMHGALIEKCEITPASFQDLRFIQRGTPLRMELAAEPWRDDDVADLIEFLDNADAAPLSRQPPKAARTGKAFDIGELWQTLIDLEGEFIPTVTIVRRISVTPDGTVFEYEADRPFDFADDSVVEVRIPDGRRGRLVGQLNLASLDDRTLAIRNQSQIVRDGEDVILVEKRAQASLDRRRRGVQKILSRDSAIPDLIDFFDPDEAKEPISFPLVPNEEEIKAYGLNSGQAAAFIDVLGQGPVGLLQGPPGTGKTRFIGALVHWLVTRSGARKILVASQSHEAVNGAAEELIKLFRARGDHLDLLRVGTKGMTSRLAPYQSVSLRERYQRRFLAGLKGRLAAAATALGVNRNLVYELVDLDRALGIVARRIFLLEESLQDGDLYPEERRRIRQRLSSAERVFALAGKEVLARDVDLQSERVEVLLEEAHDRLLARHSTSTRADLTSARKLLALAHEWSETLGSGHRNFEEFLAKTRTVIAGTCVGLGQSRIRLESGTFDWVVIDEAARCTAGELAVPIQLGRRILLVGDHLQLPPMINRAIVEATAKEIPGLNERDIERSDFERAFSSSYGRRTGQVLQEQYRMVEPICRLVSRTFYAPHGVKLATSRDRESDPRFSIPVPELLMRPVTWIDTSKAQRAREKVRHKGQQIWNEAEIEVTIRLLAMIAGESDFARELAAGEEMGIGVICMYKEQKKKIGMAFAQRPFDDAFRRTVKIDTVDSYQGKENAIVIVSLVRSNPTFVAGHVRKAIRCNVALSRARERLYVIGHTGMWSDRRVRSPMREVLKSIRETTDGTAAVVMAGEVR